jgi:hypothetical protein
MRLSAPALQGVRGAGLGNEVLAWAKAFIGARELGLRALHPAWALNPRGYRKDFGTSFLDWPATQCLRALPRVTVDTAMATSHDDYVDVMRDLKERIAATRGPLVLWHQSGMSGGYYGIRQARDYIYTQLVRPERVATDLYHVRSQLDPGRLTVAMHIRAGDFAALECGPRPGEFNRTIPIEWYSAVAKTVQRILGDRAQFLIFTDDAESEALRKLADRINAVPLPDRDRPLLSDIIAMAQADLLVCSVSSLSMLAAFLSEKSYIWYGPHLREVGDWRSIWGHEPQQQVGLTYRNATTAPKFNIATRGMPADEDGNVPDVLGSVLEQAASLKDARRDLLMYGVVPASRFLDLKK